MHNRLRRPIPALAWLVLAAAAFSLPLVADDRQSPAEDARPPFPVPRMTAKRTDVEPFRYVEAKIAYYPPDGDRRGGGAWNRMQLPLEPAESIKHVVVPEGFRVELFASEPQIGKPVCMNWDERGRLWIAETVDYPNDRQPEGRGNDCIRICEDTDGDGRADKFTVFAERLSIPTSLAFSHGGVIVHQAPQTLFLKDTDGDGRANLRVVLLEGWNTDDTHAGPSNMHYGLDNWFWGVVGYAGFDGEVGGERHRFRQGFHRFRFDRGHIERAIDRESRRSAAAQRAARASGRREPPVRASEESAGSRRPLAVAEHEIELEFIRSTNNNTWGLSLSEEGLVFGSTANRNPSVFMPVANRYYESVRGWSAGQLGGIADTHLFRAATDKVRQVDHHGGYTAAAGHALYTARAYPKEYWNRAAFVCGPTGHLVGTFVLTRGGSEYKSTNPFNLFASDDEWTAPIMAEVGPDGQVWVIDWYNYIVQHNPTPADFKTGKGNAYETDLRDKKHGRIYRVVYEAARPSTVSDLHGATPQKLVETLRHDNLLWRRHAQRLLVERGRLDVLPQLIELARDPAVDEIGLNTAAIHALWTMHGLGVFDEPKPAGQASNLPNAGQVEDLRHETRRAAIAAAVAALRHKSPGVRMNAVRVLPRSDASLTAILESGLLNDRDAHVRLASLLTLSKMPSSARAGRAIVSILNRPENAADRWIADAATSAAAAHDLPFLNALAAEKTAAARLLEVAATVAEHYARGGPVDTVGQLMEALPAADPKTAETIITGLAAGWPQDGRVPLSQRSEKTLARLLVHLPAGGRGRLVRLATLWGSDVLDKQAGEIARSLLSAVADEKSPDDERIALARQLVELRREDPKPAETLLGLVSPRSSPALAAGLIEAVGRSRAEWTRALLDGIEKGRIHLSDLTLDQKQALAGHPDRRLRDRARQLLARGGGLPSPDRQMVLDELMPLTKQTGDPALGKEVFKKHCAKCHTHSGEGEKVGPDLTGMAVHPRAELLTHIIDPSRSVEGNYRVYTVVTDDGRVVNGLPRPRTGKLAWWENSPRGRTIFYGAGRAGSIETTALAALAMLSAGEHPATVRGALAWLVTQKDHHGTWHSTQATVLALKALIAGTGRPLGGERKRRIRIALDGAAAREITIPADEADVMKQIDVSSGLGPGSRRLVLTDQTGTAPGYQVTFRYHVPQTESRRITAPEDRADLRPDRPAHWRRRHGDRRGREQDGLDRPDDHRGSADPGGL